MKLNDLTVSVYLKFGNSTAMGLSHQPEQAVAAKPLRVMNGARVRFVSDESTLHL